MTRIFNESVLAGKILLFNPVAQTIQDARHGMLQNIIPSSSSLFANGALLLIPLGVAVAVFVLGAWYFRRRSPYFAEKV
jgi:ABC-2 type transport system permease protein